MSPNTALVMFQTILFVTGIFVIKIPHIEKLRSEIHADYGNITISTTENFHSDKKWRNFVVHATRFDTQRLCFNRQSY